MPTHKPIALGDDSMIQTLLDAVETYPAMLEAIAEAKQSIRFANYCMVPGEVFDLFAEALVEAAGRGVRVQILLDRYGSRDTYPQHLTPILEAGVELQWRREFKPRHPLRYNRGLHKKLLIIDNDTGFFGGIGVGDFWADATPDYPAPWRDTHFLVTGTIIKKLSDSFDQSWDDKAYQSRGLFQLSPVGATILNLITSAKHQINITTAYFGPSRPIRKALQQAAKRGVTIRILTNGPFCTHANARDSGRHLYGSLLAAGIHIYEYQPTKIHTKIITTDGATSLIGSANLNFRSLYHDEEFSLPIKNKELTKQLDQQFECDLEQAQEITPAAWSQRPTQDRLRQATASLARYIF